jgi:hypothetical protein
MSIIVKVIADQDPTSPREWDNLGVMACWHRNYNLGDVQPKQDAAEWLAENAPKGSIVLPLYLYDHSGITMSVGKFSCPWDSGQVGYIVATPEAIRKNFMVKRITAKIRAQAEECLKSEVQTYDDYLTGNVWGFTIESTHPCGECGAKVHENEREDSCWGFIGDTAMEAMKCHVDPKHHEALEAAWANRW